MLCSLCGTTQCRTGSYVIMCLTSKIIVWDDKISPECEVIITYAVTSNFCRLQHRLRQPRIQKESDIIAIGCSIYILRAMLCWSCGTKNVLNRITCIILKALIIGSEDSDL